MIRSRMALSGFAALAMLMLAGAACSGADDTSSGASDTTDGAATSGDIAADDRESQPGGTLTFGLASETSGWNPAADQFTLSGYQVTQAVYDRLMAYDENDEVQPYLAEVMEPNDDFTEWTIGLREGITFHDGTPLDAEVLKQNLDALIQSPLLGQVVQAMEEVQIVDELTVRVIMNTPWSSFPHTLTAQPGIVVAPSVLTEPDGGQNPVGTGPFVFEEWIPGERLTVTRNDAYWREGYPLLDGVEFRIMTDPVTRSNALRGGEIDVMEVRDAGELVDFEEAGDDFQVHVDEQGETTEDVFFVHTGRPPFDDPDARLAVAHALDTERLAETVYTGRFEAAEGPFKESSPWYREVDYPSYDPERAEELAAAYEDEHGEPLSFTLNTPTSATASQTASLLQEMFDQVGIQMDTNPIEATTGLIEVLGGNYQAGTINALFGSTHPDREYTFLHGSNADDALATAFTRMQNDDVDEGLDAARETGDLEEQTDAWEQVQEGLAEEAAFVFLVHTEVGDVALPKVQDLTTWTFPDGEAGLPQEQNVVSLYQVWLDE